MRPHTCLHDDVMHVCHCGMGHSHTHDEFTRWAWRRGLTVLPSEVQ